ncbi:hypothetical protein AAE02nite_38230 [Adhaeribacter aerolatus]|uniref:DUF6884 domain-containing protein n=1 Tax=Adhaeribacter aerolatus TaxID=670289 RepID=A0A512B2H7_9BACT|nr:DUF6884 domain-containing protein [Adhaeribacter aerolatus]GEO06159.1 hypothetical protein AAE02nite_38230 [Adhaeribacter aerolatus]
MTRLLLLSCSQLKKNTTVLLPAIERYDGPFFKVLRKYRESPNSNLPLTFILSAEHSLIAADELIGNYDRKMTLVRARELQPLVEEKLNGLIQRKTELLQEVMVCMSNNYLEALNPSQLNRLTGYVQESEPKIIHTQGSIGKQVSNLYEWLYQAPPPEIDATGLAQIITFHGKEIKYNVNEILHIAFIKAKEDPIGAARFESWFVPIGELRVAPKWLLSILTGVPVGQFRTLDARKILTQLGVEIKRI